MHTPFFSCRPFNLLKSLCQHFFLVTSLFDIPTSLTLNRDIAYNLSRTINYGRGIAIELSHGGLSDLQSLSLDLSYLSDYPSEKEQLIFDSYLSFHDVIINIMHHDEWLKILRFWYKIKEGFF